MKTRCVRPAVPAWILAWGLVLFFGEGRGPAQQRASALQRERGTNVIEQAACERQLNLIYGALQEYRKQHENKLPDKLSELLQEFIDDPDKLVCPFVRTRGGLRVWTKNFADLAHDAFTSYSYELPPGIMNHTQWRGVPKKTIREFKEKQREVFGPVVPIVRCHDHVPFLSLAFDGTIYPTPQLHWERSFTTNEALLTVATLFARPARQPARTEFAPRPAGAPPQLVDLTAYYNATLTNAWQGFPGNNLAELPTGLQTFDGISFDVRGVIQVRGTEIAAEFPQAVTNIAIHQTCRRVHFLQAVSFRTRAVSGAYDIRYVNGQVETVPLHYGRQVADWWYDPTKPRTVTEAKVAWRGENEATRAYGTALCLYHYVWENPHPALAIATLDLDAGEGQELDGPFCVAITLE